MPDSISGKFVHVLENCDNSNPEENCSEFIEFSGADQANILVGGDDIVHKFSYKIMVDILVLEEPLTSSFILNFDFKIVDSKTLERTDNGDLWKKWNSTIQSTIKLQPLISEWSKRPRTSNPPLS